MKAVSEKIGKIGGEPLLWYVMNITPAGGVKKLSVALGYQQIW